MGKSVNQIHPEIDSAKVVKSIFFYFFFIFLHQLTCANPHTVHWVVSSLHLHRSAVVWKLSLQSQSSHRVVWDHSSKRSMHDQCISASDFSVLVSAQLQPPLSWDCIDSLSFCSPVNSGHQSPALQRTVTQRDTVHLFDRLCTPIETMKMSVKACLTDPVPTTSVEMCLY